MTIFLFLKLDLIFELFIGCDISGVPGEIIFLNNLYNSLKGSLKLSWERDIMGSVVLNHPE